MTQALALDMDEVRADIEANGPDGPEA